MNRGNTRPFSVLKNLVAGFCALAMLFAGVPAQASSRIKDIATFEGVRDNILIGYGLVVGLQGTGDGLDNSEFTKQSLIGMLERLGVNARSSGLVAGSNTGLKAKDVAAVVVTATLASYARQGTRIDVTVSALGDATSLYGGTLLVTPLVGADGEVYAVGQGQITAGYIASGAAASVTKNVTTSGRVANGAVIEREVGVDMSRMESVQISLRNPDFTTARRIAQAVNAYLGSDTARPTDPATVRLAVPPRYLGNTVALLTDIEQLQVQPDQIARVVIDNRTGTIVMGENVRVSTVAIAQGSLTIRITETPQVSQPSPFSSTGSTTTVNRTDIQVDEGADKKLAVVRGGVTLQELVDGLNSLGIAPTDLINILQAIKAAGAMQATIEVM
ncbi:flagellar basal body P-ring protein FlgI [Telmatospirillum siberiense]|uniref:Flagellar P-ring protein n=1 Tax=Telmatospirillum siberiense TaxID=382514 RepID=A0A2N3PZZ3_9PROT|nr:flagellar biosynthesis protein FlgA [Telmatospirillum siberiense]